jgi:hypothetical protein
MDIIEKAIMKEMKRVFDEDESVNLRVQLNELEVISYFDKKHIRFHRDQRYNSKGEFMERQNSQRKQSLTCILAVGDSRSLLFQLMRRRTKEETGRGFIKLNVEGASKEFKLSNGSLFFLHPDDEEDQRRLEFDKECLTFFQHGSKGVESDVGMSFGLVFRSCCHVKEVSKRTGQLIEPEHDIGLLRRTKRKLEDFLAGRTTTKDGMTKDQADKWLQAKYLQTKSRHQL